MAERLVEWRTVTASCSLTRKIKILAFCSSEVVVLFLGFREIDGCEFESDLQYLGLASLGKSKPRRPIASAVWTFHFNTAS